MSREYWDSVAPDYEGSVLSVFERDHEGAVRARIERHADPSGSAADLGCGVGNFTPALASSFASVEACDFSPASLERARARCGSYHGVRFHELDIVSEAAPFEPVDFALCINVLIMSGLDERMRAWRFVTNQVARGGHLLVVVPSLEFLLFQHYLAVSEALEDGMSCEAAEGAASQPGCSRDMLLGVHPLQGRPTKHYLADELRALMREHHFEDVELTRLWYRWTDEDGAPWEIWDWLILARRS